MSDTAAKISVRLPPAIQHALAARVRQDRMPVPDIIRQALEAYLGLRPTACPTAPVDLADSLSDMQRRIEAMAANLSDIQARLRRLEALEGQYRHIRQGPTNRPTTRPTGRPGLPRETLAQIAEAHRQHPEMRLHTLAQHLFDTGIYQSKNKAGALVPVDHSRLSRWLQRAEAEGLL